MMESSSFFCSEIHYTELHHLETFVCVAHLAIDSNCLDLLLPQQLRLGVVLDLERTPQGIDLPERFRKMEVHRRVELVDVVVQLLAAVRLALGFAAARVEPVCVVRSVDLLALIKVVVCGCLQLSRMESA